MPTLEIIRDQPKPREIRIGQADKVIEPRSDAEQGQVAESIADLTSSLETFQRNIEKAGETKASVPDSPPEQTVKNKGRKKMSDKKLDHELGGPETIREDKAGEQGAIGSHGVNAPAQTKVPQSDKGKEEGKAHG